MRRLFNNHGLFGQQGGHDFFRGFQNAQPHFSVAGNPSSQFYHVPAADAFILPVGASIAPTASPLAAAPAHIDILVQEAAPQLGAQLGFGHESIWGWDPLSNVSLFFPHENDGPPIRAGDDIFG